MTIDGAFTQFPLLATDRLILRQIQSTDADAFFAMRSDVEITSRFGQEPHLTLDDTLAWLRRIQGNFGQREGIFWCITRKGDDTVIGACCFWNFDPSFHCVELGYELYRPYWRQGIITEAASAVLSYGFNELGLNRIEADPLAENTPSVGVLHKLGFTLEGNLRQRVYFRGQYSDQLYFGLLKNDWLKAK